MNKNKITADTIISIFFDAEYFFMQKILYP